MPAPGTVVAWWEHDLIAFGVVVTEEKQRVVLVTADGREERAAPARIVAVLASGAAPAVEWFRSKIKPSFNHEKQHREAIKAAEKTLEKIRP